MERFFWYFRIFILAMIELVKGCIGLLMLMFAGYCAVQFVIVAKAMIDELLS